MDQPFDYTRFSAEFDLQQALRTLCTTLQAAAQADGTILLPQSTADTLGPLDQLLKDLKIENPTAQPNFAFQCPGVTLKSVEQHCLENGLDLDEMTMHKGNKIYYNRTFDEDTPEWVELSRPEASDPAHELNELIFLDSKHSVVDWKSSLDNLKRLSSDRQYTDDMMYTCLFRLINRFLPEQTQLLKGKSPDEIANFLLKVDSKVDKLTYYRQQLFTFQRNPGEELDAVLARIQNVVDKIYPATVQENLPHRDTVMKTAVISFLPDMLSMPLMAEIKKAAERCEPMTYEAILSRALAAERHAQIALAVPLTFGRQINAMTAAGNLQLNSMNIDLSSIPNRRNKDFYGETAEQYPSYYSPAYENNANRQVRHAPIAPLAPQAMQAVQAYNAAPVMHAAQALPAQAPALFQQVLPAVQAQQAVGQAEQVQQPQVNLRPEAVYGAVAPHGGQSHLLQSPIGTTPNTPPARQHQGQLREINSLPTVDYRELNPNMGLIQDPQGYLAVLSGRQYRVVNTPERLPETGTPLSAKQPERIRLTDRMPVSPAEAGSQVLATETLPVSQYEGPMTRQRQKELSKNVSLNSVYFRDFNDEYFKRQDSRGRSRERSHYGDNSRKRDGSRQRDSSRSGDNSHRRDSSRKGDCSCQRNNSGKGDNSHQGDNSKYRDSSSQKGNESSGRGSSRGRDSSKSSSHKGDNRPNAGSSRDRDSSGKGGNSGSRNSSGQRQPSKGRSDSKNRSSSKERNSRSRSKDTESTGRARSRSAKERAEYPAMKKGYNCSYDYRPGQIKFCRKCPDTWSHHEFDCVMYDRYFNGICGKCKAHRHYTDDCQNIVAFPPATGSVNSITLANHEKN